MFVLFPVSDYYQLDELLTPEEKNLRINIRQFMENEVAPIVPKVLLHLVHWFICAYSIYPFFSNVILVLADSLFFFVLLLWVLWIVLGDSTISIPSHSKARLSWFPWRHHQGISTFIYPHSIL